MSVRSASSCGSKLNLHWLSTWGRPDQHSPQPGRTRSKDSPSHRKTRGLALALALMVAASPLPRARAEDPAAAQQRQKGSQAMGLQSVFLPDATVASDTPTFLAKLSSIFTNNIGVGSGRLF